MATSPNLSAASLSMLLVAGLSSFALAGAASAEDAPPVEAVSVEVQLADLDLSDRTGAAIALSRIEKAAREVCREAAPRSQIAPRSFHECRRETVQRTIATWDAQTRMFAKLAAETDGATRP